MRVKGLLSLLETQERVIILNQNNEEKYDGNVGLLLKNKEAIKIINSKVIKLKCNRTIIYCEEK